MQILRRKAVIFLRGIGFKEPYNWDDEKIVRYLKQAPQRLSVEQVPVRLRSFFRSLQQNCSDITLVKSKKPLLVDAFGFRKGSFSSRVANALSSEWKDEELIAAEAGVSLDQSRSVLYRLTTNGLAQRRVRIEYRLVQPSPEVQ